MSLRVIAGLSYHEYLPPHIPLFLTDHTIHDFNNASGKELGKELGSGLKDCNL